MRKKIWRDQHHPDLQYSSLPQNKGEHMQENPMTPSQADTD